MQPGQNRSLLTQVASRIAPDYLVVSDVRLLEIVATAHHQKLESVFRACVPVELRGRARTLTKIVELLRFRWIEKSGRGESIDEEVVANAPVLAAVIGVQVVIFERGAAKVYVSVAAEISARTRGDVEYAPEAVAIFGRESASHQVHSFENLRTCAWTELWLGIVEKRDAVDELMQRELSAANGNKIIVAVAGAWHEVGDEVVRGFSKRLGKTLKILMSEGI